MCQFCGQMPRLSRCPNCRDEEPELIKCRFCKALLYEGNRYLSTPKGSYCLDCLETFTPFEWLEMLDLELEEV